MEMNIINFEGRVLPEHRQVTVPQMNSIRYIDPSGFNAIIDVSVVKGVIKVECRSTDGSDLNQGMSVVRSYECATALVDIYAFLKGWALHVTLDYMILPGVRVPIGLSETSVRQYCTALNSDEEFQQVWQIVISNFDLKFALRDLISSLSTLNYSSIAAARSVETIRKLIASKGVSEKAAWEAMRNCLNIDRAYLQRITDASREPRHGNRGAAFGKDQMVVTHRAWAILNRYLEFMKRGGLDPLPKREFPNLED
jgi:hypothetical protein